MLVTLLCGFATSCGDDDNDTLGETNSIVGSWQVYQIVEDDGSVSDGDQEEIWVYESNGAFKSLYNGIVCDEGTYKVLDDALTINIIDENNDSWSLNGKFEIKNNLMTYTYSSSDAPNDHETIVFKRM